MKLNCATCNKEFTKEQKEYNRQLKSGRNRFFCSRTCAAIINNKENPRKGNIETLISSNRKDEFTPFRWFILRSQYRDRKKNYGCDLTADYIKQLWELQNGICPFSNRKMILPQNSEGWKKPNPYNASLDRINNSLGYVQGNVRFVCIMANLARQTFTDEQLIEFCKAVSNNI